MSSDLESDVLPLHQYPIRTQISLPVYVLEHPFLVGIYCEDAALPPGNAPGTRTLTGWRVRLLPLEEKVREGIAYP